MQGVMQNIRFKRRETVEKQYKLQSVFRLAGEKKAFGPGIAELLEGVERLGSLSKSARKMGMSYSKAWTVVHGCERELGFLLIESRIGGKNGGGAGLTGEAREMLSRYRAFEAEAQTELGRLAGKYFPEYFADGAPPKDCRPWVLVRGAGDLATGIIVRLFYSGFRVAVTECGRPSAIRRKASLCEAVWDGEAQVEGAACRLAGNREEALAAERDGFIPLFVDEEAACISYLRPAAVVDAILAKRNLGTSREMAPVTVGVGPGFTAGEDVDAVVETMRGHFLGRVIWEGAAIPNTGVPGVIGGFDRERVIYSPADGTIKFAEDEQGRRIDIGASVRRGQIIAAAGDSPVRATLDGVLRGLIREGYPVKRGMKIADIDPRPEQSAFCGTVSDKARAVAGGVMEALLCAAARKGISLL